MIPFLAISELEFDFNPESGQKIRFRSYPTPISCSLYAGWYFWVWKSFGPKTFYVLYFSSKVSAALGHFDDKTVARCFIPWGHYTAGAKKIQPLVFMCSKPTLSFSNVGAKLLEKWTLFSVSHFDFWMSDFVACSKNLWTTQIPCYYYSNT